MGVCARCAQENPEVARFCLACGSPLAPVQPPVEERKLVSVVFTDIVGSTARAESLDPEDVRALLAPYYARLRKELERFGGTVEKFIGDAVVALFGAPVAHEDDPERAVRAALAIRGAIDELNGADEWLDLKIRVGVNTGEALVVVGANASEGEGMASGDVMNTAARLQSAAPVNGVVVGELTYRATREVIEYREAAPIAAKGKSERVPAWEAVRVHPDASRGRRAENTLVGRERHAAELLELWRVVVAEGRPARATILGPPGIGKSRLLGELADRVAADAGVHWGRCLSYGEGITYWPLVELLKSAVGILQSDGSDAAAEKLDAFLDGLGTDDRGELRTIAAALSNLIGIPTTPRGTYSAGRIAQAELHWGIRRALHLLARRRPLLLVFEDLHWAEPTLLELIAYLAEPAPDAPLLLLCSARPELAESAPAFPAPRGGRRTIELERLSAEESRRLLAHMVGDASLAETPLATALIENADGNPLFLEETVRMLREQGLDDPRRWQGERVERLPLPATVQALISSRLDRLEGGEKRVAHDAAVVGAVFWDGAVAHLGAEDGGAPVDPHPALGALLRRDFVRRNDVSTLDGEDEYAFEHVLIKDVAYGQIPKGRRAQLHVRCADWVTRLPAGAEKLVEIVAWHLEQACRLSREVARSPIEPPLQAATDALAAAAGRAEQREGLREAARYYERALDLLGDSDRTRSLELRQPLARAHAQLGELHLAGEELVSVAWDARELGRPDVRGAALVALGNIDHRQGRPSDARRRLVEARELALAAGDRALQVRAAFGLAAVRADYEAEGVGAVDDLRHAVGVAEEIDARALRVEGHLRLGFLLFNLGRIGDSERELLRCLDLAGELGSLRDEARAVFLFGLVRYYQGDPAQAERLNLQARDWLERTGEPYFQMQNFRALGLYALARGNLDEAEQRLRQAIPVALEEGGRYILEVYRFLTETLVRAGRVADAATLTEFASRDMPAEDAVAHAYVTLARAAVAAGEGDRHALELYADAIGCLERQLLPIEAADARMTFAAALKSFGDIDGAAVQLAGAREAFERMGASGPCGQIDEELGRVAGGAG
ncbi:MAG: hypothetical protein V7644_2078 [Actinomycetota bacterium]